MNYPKQQNLSNFTTEILEKCKGIEDTLKSINTEGCYLWKVRSRTRWFRRRFYMNIEDMKIQYSPTIKGNYCWSDNIPEVEFSDICEVRKGWKTDVFNKVIPNEGSSSKGQNQRFTRRYQGPEENCCFSIIFGEKKDKTLDLVATSPEIADNWVKVIEHLLTWYELKRTEEGYELWLRKKFNAVDKDRNNCLSLRETSKLLDELNIDMTEMEVKKLFDEANTNIGPNNEEQFLDVEEFLTLYFKLISRPEIQEIMKKYTGGGGALSLDQLQQFLQTEESGYENISSEDCIVLIRIFEHSDAKDKELMTLAGFTNMLLSSDFDVFDKHHKHIHQDMTKPLSKYFIASSHNTYIMGNQLVGKNSVEAYIEALKRGCKCVEIDCWDGDDEEPIVWHGKTLTTKLLFREVIQDAIKPYAFVASPYPLILSLEVHCSLPYRTKMATYLHELLGNMLYIDSVDGLEELPSPEALHGKILLKGKTSYSKSKKKKASSKKISTVSINSDEIQSRSTRTVTTISTTSRVITSSGDINATSKNVSSVFIENVGDGIQANTFLDNENSIPDSSFSFTKQNISDDSGQDESYEDEDSESDSDSIDGQNKFLTTSNDPLCELINLIQAVKFTSFENSSMFGKCYQMSSFSESTANKLIKENGSDFVNYNKRQLSRIYPGATRTSSSNFYPNLYWKAGCQIVALNYQTPDIPNLINRAMFKQNGGAGYVLKPKFLLEGEQFNPNRPHTRPWLLTIRIISGQHLPKIEGTSDIVDPYVELKIMGIYEDVMETKFTTKKVQNNGFNPMWDESFQIAVKCPQLSFLYIRVRDYSQSGSDLPLGYYVLPLSAMATGYRHVHLVNLNGEPIPPSTLFIHVTKHE